MTRYRVFLTATASYGVVVEAENEADAMDKAELEGAPGLCHHCSSIDLSDFEAREDEVEEA